MPEAVQPMLARLGVLPADDAAWAYEIKWDGVRAIARVDAGRVALTGRNGSDFTPRYPEVCGLGHALGSRRLILDGEVVALDGEGRPSFERLQSRMHLAGASAVKRRMHEIPATYVAFDLLWLDGRSTLGLAYVERRRLLDALELSGPAWSAPAHREGDGAALLEAARGQALEGIVAKRLDSVYEPGRRSGVWIKVKNHLTQDTVIGAFTPGEGGRTAGFGALCVGVYEGRALRYAGKVGSGFTEAGLAAVGSRLAALARDASPFDGRQPPRGARFVEPLLVARVEFREWTRTATLRAPVFKGLRDDVDPAQAVRQV